MVAPAALFTVTELVPLLPPRVTPWRAPEIVPLSRLFTVPAVASLKSMPSALSATRPSVRIVPELLIVAPWPGRIASSPPDVILPVAALLIVIVASPLAALSKSRACPTFVVVCLVPVDWIVPALFTVMVPPVGLTPM